MISDFDFLPAWGFPSAAHDLLKNWDLKIFYYILYYDNTPSSTDIVISHHIVSGSFFKRDENVNHVVTSIGMWRACFAQPFRTYRPWSGCANSQYELAFLSLVCDVHSSPRIPRKCVCQDRQIEDLHAHLAWLITLKQICASTHYQ